MRKAKRFTVLLLVAVMCLDVVGCGGSGDKTESNTMMESSQEIGEPMVEHHEEKEAESWPRVDDFAGKKKYEFDKNNWISYGINDRGGLDVNIYCEDDFYPVGEMCFSSLLKVAKENFEGFAITYKSDDSVLLYAKVAGTLISEEVPEFKKEDIDAEREEKVQNFMDCCIGFLEENGVQVQGYEGWGIYGDENEIGTEDYDEGINKDNMVVYYIMAKEIVESGLKNPKSADFPSITFSPEEIAMQKTGDIVAVQSYVEAKNDFGAKVRTDWIVEFEVIDVDTYSYNLIYANIGGQEYGEFIELE